MAVCAIGGTLKVMYSIPCYSIPLRRALVTGSELPYPDGVSAAEVLKVGDTGEGSAANKLGVKVILAGALASAEYGPDTCRHVVCGGKPMTELPCPSTFCYVPQ